MESKTDSKKNNETKNPNKKNGLKDALLKPIRLAFFRTEYFIGDYHENEKQIRKFIVDNNVVLLDVYRGKDKIHQFDYRLSKTKANKKDREVYLTYAKDPKWIRRLLWVLHVLGASIFTKRSLAEDNYLMRSLGFRDNRVERTRLGV